MADIPDERDPEQSTDEARSPLIVGLDLLAQAERAPAEDAGVLLEQAVRSLSRARASRETPLAANLALGRAQLGLRVWDQARLSFRRALATSPSETVLAHDVEEALGRVGVGSDWRMWASNSMEEALSGLGKGEQWRLWAEDVRKGPDSGRALRAYYRAVAADDRDSEAWLGGGGLLTDLQRPYEALEWYGSAIDAAMRHSDVTSHVAILRIRAGSIRLELHQYRQALAEASGAIEMLDHLSDRAQATFAALSAQSQSPAATLGMRAFEESVEDMRNWAGYLVGWAYYGLRQYTKAVEYFDRAGGWNVRPGEQPESARRRSGGVGVAGADSFV